jgi:hypothetical protein
MAAKKPLGVYAGDVEGFEVGDFIDIAFGGTGAIDKTNAFDNLSPSTTKGDLTVFNGTDNIRIPVGVDGQVLAADSVQPSGIKWITSSAGGAVSPISVAGRSFLLMGG